MDQERMTQTIMLMLLLYACNCESYGYDSGGDQGACGRQYRSGRMHRPPCDLAGDGYCTSAGSAYPWHAVKRFVRENQGLMRRMYGDQRHGQVLRAELVEEEAPLQPIDNGLHFFRYDDRKMYSKQDLDFNADNTNELFPRRDENEPRYLRDEDISNDDVLNTKFVYSEEPAISIKLADLKASAPHFRPLTTPKTSTTTTTTTTTSATPPSTSEASIVTTTTEDSGSTSTTQTEDINISTVESTTDTTTDQAEKSANGSGSSTSSSTTGESDDDSSKPGAVLFQDMEDSQNKNKVHVNYQMRGVNACPVKEEVVAPFWANNTRGEVLALLNMYPFEQYVHWEKCTHEHRQMYCRDGCRCEQQYRLHRLLAYDPNNECRGIFSDWFRFPSCCVCKCYSIPPAEFRVTSRSPRYGNDHSLPDHQQQEDGLPDWYLRKNKAIFSSGDHG